MMKRMIYIWLLLIGMILGVGLFHRGWSVFTNDWAKVFLILLILLLGIEIGLYYWRRRMLNLSQLVKNTQSRTIQTEQEEHYIPIDK